MSCLGSDYICPGQYETIGCSDVLLSRSCTRKGFTPDKCQCSVWQGHSARSWLCSPSNASETKQHCICSSWQVANVIEPAEGSLGWLRSWGIFSDKDILSTYTWYVLSPVLGAKLAWAFEMSFIQGIVAAVALSCTGPCCAI